ncbi:MAG: pentapeptide repeat-containing protein, partial [Solirubrobacteraceae bacterium]
MTWSRRTWAVAIVVGTLVTVGYVYLAIVVVPAWRADRIKSSKPEAQASARENERVSVRTAMLAVLAGAIAAAGAVYTGRTYALNKREAARTFELNRRGQRTDRFTRAVDQLGEDGKLDVRLGGIYALEQLAKESAEDHGPIMEVLCAYVRGHAPAKERERPVEEPLGEGPPADHEPGVQPWAPVGDPPVDIQAVITVLARRREDHDARARLKLDLRHADLRFVDIRGLPAPFAHLDGAIFFDANLTEAIVTHANLAGAYLDGAICFAADLSQADLSDAYLRGAYLTGANLTGANLTRANLTRANLTRANLTANLAGATFTGGTLTAANLNNAI